MARRRSRQLFDLLAGFTYSQVLFTCVKLDLFERLAKQELSVSRLAAEAGWPIEKMERLLKAAVALKLLEKTSSGRYGLGIHGAALVGNPWIAKFVAHHHLLYADLADPLALLKGEVERPQLGSYWAYANAESPDKASETQVAGYTQLMAASQAAVAREVLDQYDFSRARCILDVGGGDGSFLAALAERYDDPKLMLFDLPGVVSLARQSLGRKGLGNRVEIHGGSFLSGTLPEGADVITLVRIVHDHDDASVVTLLRGARRALMPGGRLLIAEPLSGVRGTEGVSDAYFNLYFAAMGQGRTRSAAEIAQLGREAGFGAAMPVRTRMPLITGMMILSA